MGRTEGLSNSAEVIITQDSNASGVVKKPGFNGSTMVSFKNGLLKITRN